RRIGGLLPPGEIAARRGGAGEVAAAVAVEIEEGEVVENAVGATARQDLLFPANAVAGRGGVSRQRIGRLAGDRVPDDGAFLNSHDFRMAVAGQVFDRGSMG